MSWFALGLNGNFICGGVYDHLGLAPRSSLYWVSDLEADIENCRAVFEREDMGVAHEHL